jgi:hypothetical protein
MTCNSGLYCCARVSYGGWYPCEHLQVTAPKSQVLQPSPAGRGDVGLPAPADTREEFGEQVEKEEI